MAAERQAKYPLTTIRFRIGADLVVQATFKSRETVSALYEFMRTKVAVVHDDFYLYTTPPMNKLTDMHTTLYDARLAPSAIVHCSSTVTRLRDELMAQVKDIPVHPSLSTWVPQAGDGAGKSSATRPKTPPAKREVPPPRAASPKQEGKSVMPKWFTMGKK